MAIDEPERYRWAQKTLAKRRYWRLGKTDQRAATRYLIKETGYSSAQTKRLIYQYVKTEPISVKPARRDGFKRAHSEADILMLASMDERHDHPNGAVLKNCMSGLTSTWAKPAIDCLESISVVHLYNLQACP